MTDDEKAKHANEIAVLDQDVADFSATLADTEARAFAIEHWNWLKGAQSGHQPSPPRPMTAEAASEIRGKLNEFYASRAWAHS